MDKIRLNYFDMNGGRGEPTRIAMSIGNIEFEDHRISFPEFSKMRKSTPLNALPTVDINGTTYTQSNSMNRYFGKRAGLYPDDDWEAFKCDEIMDAIEDLLHKLVQTFGLEGEELKAARKKLVDDTLTMHLKFLNTRLQAAGGKYFAGNKLTVADLKVFCQIRSLTSGILDHVPVDLTSKVAPLLIEHMERVAEEPGVVAYYKKLEASA